jgi:hypothetical protein
MRREVMRRYTLTRRVLGPGQQSKVDAVTVSMSHPVAFAAMMDAFVPDILGAAGS